MNKSEKLLRISAFAPIAMLLVLAGCKGTTAQSAAALPSSTAFGQWSQIAPGTTVQATGISAHKTYAAGGDGSVQNIGGGIQGTGGASFVGAYDNGLNLTILTLQTASGYTFTIVKTAGDTIAAVNVAGSPGAYIGATSANNRNSALVTNSPANGWDYQGFGVWMTGQGVGGTVGAISYGNPSSAVPLAGTANFSGNAAGVYTNAAGVSAMTTSNMYANVDFGALTVAFGTSGTMVGNSSLAKNITAVSPNSSLDMSGTLAISGTQFAGVVQTAGGMTGQSTGQFYGPAAQDIGGTFPVSGGGVQSLVGAYGGKAH